MKKTRFTVGLVTKDYAYEFSLGEAKLMIAKILSEHKLYGYTLIETHGMWEAQTEPSIIIEIVGRCAVKTIAKKLRKEFRQSKVLTEHTYQFIEFI